MSPKEKAIELIEKFRIHQPVWELKEDAKQCALIAVDEILNAIKPFGLLLGKDYWEEVKQEIEKL